MKPSPDCTNVCTRTYVCDCGFPGKRKLKKAPFSPLLEMTTSRYILGPLFPSGAFFSFPRIVWESMMNLRLDEA